MADHKLTHFPVGNGDCSLIELADRTQIVIDCNFTEASHDEGDDARYDVHGHLLRVAKKARKPGLDGIPYVDAFVLTHPDEDHCRGFGEGFYTGDPSRYSQSHLDRELILISELWFAPRIFWAHEDLCESAKAFRRETKRRMDLWKARDPSRNNVGNRIRILGYTDNPEIQGCEEVVTTPGNYINHINGSDRPDFRFFVHAPFKDNTDDAGCERNDTSVVLQAQFDTARYSCAGTAFFLGDIGHEVIAKIVELSDGSTLMWDVLLSSHHCSWSFFGDDSDLDEEPAEGAMTFLGKRREGAIVVASCKPIRNDDDNPPHWRAAEVYRDAVGPGMFVELAEHPDEAQPLPLELSLTDNGWVEEESQTASSVVSSGAIGAAVSTPTTYGG